MGAGDASPTRDPDRAATPLRTRAVDPITGRAEEIPDTEIEPPERPPIVRSAAAIEAGERLSAVIAHVGLTEVIRSGDVVQQVSLGSLDESALRDWFRDVDTFGETDRNARLEADLRIAVGGASNPANAPNADQQDALRQLASAAAGPIRVRWHELRGVPSRIEGALHVARGVDSASLAATFVAAHTDMLRRLTGADGTDVLDPADSSGDEEAALDTVVFVRIRDGLRVQSNHIEVGVTRASHPWGGGVVARLDIRWDRDLDPVSGRAMMSAEAAIALAEDAMERNLDRTSTRSFIACGAFGGRPHRCHPAWSVRWTGGSGPDLRSDRRSDTALIHAVTGEVLQLSRSTHDYTGTVDVNTNYPFDSGDVNRDMGRAELVQAAFPFSYRSSTDDDGAYNWSPSMSTAANVDLRTFGWTNVIDIVHQDTHDCSFDETPRLRSVTLGGASTVNYATDSVSAGRTEALMFNWMIYLSRMMAFDFSNQAKLPVRIWYDATPTAGFPGGQTVDCNGTSEEAAMSIDAEDDTGAQLERTVLGHEFMHAVQWCTEELGAGCAFTPDGTGDFSGPWTEGQGDALSAWFQQYESNYLASLGYGRGTYQGPSDTDDFFLHDTEIEGTTTGSGGCNLSGSYQCAGNEACWLAAHDKPRCMRRPTSTGTVADCMGYFPSQPGWLLDVQAYGQTPTSSGIPICVHNNYQNGHIFPILTAQLFPTAGFFGGLGAMIGANRDRPSDPAFTQGTDNFHDLFAEHGPDYEVSDAFHTISTESFAWLDDTTGIRSHAEVIRTPRDVKLYFTNGGPTGTALQFDSTTDQDAFLVLGDNGTSYTFEADPISGTVDLCVTAYDWISGSTLGTAAGCTDGTGTGNTDAALTVAFPSNRRVVFVVSNVLATSGATYSLEVSAEDDYPDSLADAATAGPLGHGDQRDGNYDSDTDYDLFRYDVPLGDTGDLTFTVGGGEKPDLEVYLTLGLLLPTGSPIATGSESITITSPAPGYRYYLRVVSPSGLSYPLAYTVTATQSGCTYSCNQTGTFASPRPMPSSIGGTLWNAIDHGNAGATYGTWTACADGTACDWYETDLAEGARLTATLSRVYDSICSLELAVFAPTDEGYWTYPDGGTTAYTPPVLDQGGSMEDNGAQLSFVARRAGTYRLRVRGTTTNDCPHYELTTTRGGVDTDQPPAIH